MKLQYLLFSFFTLAIFSSCKKKHVQPTVDPNIAYTYFNKSVKLSDPSGLNVDVNNDNKIDYLFFLELTYTSSGEHLYAGVNPIGNNATKAGMPNDDNFMNMGEVIAPNLNSVVDNTLSADQAWTVDHSYLTIRHKFNTGSVGYTGPWGNTTPKLMAIKIYLNGKYHFGWIRLLFDRTTELLTVVDFAWNKEANASIIAGK